MAHEKKPQDPTAPDPHADDVIVAPKGSSRTRFVMTFLLVVLMLVTFTVGDQVLDVFTGRTAVGGDYINWQVPGQERNSLGAQDFFEAKRKLAPLKRALFDDTGREREVTDEQTAVFLVLDDAASQAGVRVTDTDLRQWIEKNFQNSDNYKGFLRTYRWSNNDFEAALRRVLRVQRFRIWVEAAIAVPDPEAVERSWKSSHQEHAFDYVELPLASQIEALRAQAPQGEELEAWFRALPEPELEAFRVPEAASAEVAGLLVEGLWSAEALLARYPAPQGQDPEQLAQQYHADFGYARFRRQTGETDISKLFLTYEEVREKALAEAQLYRALMAWLADMSARAAQGQAVDFAAEAAQLGLSFRTQQNLLTTDEWQKLEVPWIGRYTCETLVLNGQDGQFLPAVTVDASSLTVSRVITKRAAHLPEFAQIAEQIADRWARAKAPEAALARLRDLREQFASAPQDPADEGAGLKRYEASEERFRELCQAAGLEVRRRDWEDRRAPWRTDLTPAEQFLRQSFDLYTQRESTVTEPKADRNGEHVYLVRIAPLRDPDLARMNPSELGQLGDQQLRTERASFTQRNLMSLEFLKQRYALDMRPWHEQPEPGG